MTNTSCLSILLHNNTSAIILYTDDRCFISAINVLFTFIDQHRIPPEPDITPATHSLTFSSSMSDEDFFKWLRSKGINNKDCKALSGKYIII